MPNASTWSVTGDEPLNADAGLAAPELSARRIDSANGEGPATAKGIMHVSTSLEEG